MALFDLQAKDPIRSTGRWFVLVPFVCHAEIDFEAMQLSSCRGRPLWCCVTAPVMQLSRDDATGIWDASRPSIQWWRSCRSEDPALENRDRKEKHRRNLQLDLEHCWNWRKSRFHRKFLIRSTNHQATILLRSCQVPWCTISPAKPMQFNAAGSVSKKGGLSGDGRGWLVYCLLFSHISPVDFTGILLDIQSHSLAKKCKKTNGRVSIIGT